MCEVLKNQIDEDENNDINRYLVNLEENQYKLLNASYCYPGFLSNRTRSKFPYKPILYFRNKVDYINIHKIKGSGWEMMGNNKNSEHKVYYGQIKKKVKKIIKKVIKKPKRS